MSRVSGDIRTAPVLPGPSGVNVLRYWALTMRDPLAAYDALRRNYGDAVRIPLGRNRSFILLNRPEYAEHVLVRHQDRCVSVCVASAATADAAALRAPSSAVTAISNCTSL